MAVAMAQPQTPTAAIANSLQVLTGLAVVACLYFARDIFVPLALGLLLTFLLGPVVSRLQKVGLPKVIAIVATALLAFVVLGFCFALIGREVSSLVADLPQYKQELVGKARTLAGMTSEVGGSIDKLAEEVGEALDNAESTPVTDGDPGNDQTEWLTDFFGDSDAKNNDGKTSKSPLYVKQVSTATPFLAWATTAGSLLGPLGTAGLVSVFSLFLLFHREDLRDRLITAVSRGNYVTTTEALDEAAARISRYLVAQSSINATYGIVLAIGLWTIGQTLTENGFPNALLWGLLATLLRFIPYLGPVLAAIFPIAISLAVFPGYAVVIAVAILIISMELICNNLIEPWLYGSSTGISAIAVIVAAVFWGWLWGPVGLLLSTPLTVCLVVLGSHVPRFKIFAILLGQVAPVREWVRVYQRLLAEDEHAAADLVKQSCENVGFDRTCDTIILPVIKRIRRDFSDEELSGKRSHVLLFMVERLIANLTQHVECSDSDRNSLDVAEPQPSKARVLVLNSHHFCESFVANLMRMQAGNQYQVETCDCDESVDGLAESLANQHPRVVVINVLPPGGFAQAKYLCTQVRESGYRGPIIVACLGRFKNFDQLFVKFRRAGATRVTTSFSQTVSKLERLTTDLKISSVDRIEGAAVRQNETSPQLETSKEHFECRPFLS